MEAELTRIDYSIAVHQLGILKALAGYDPHIAGTPPLGIHTETSDIDILFYAPEPEASQHRVGHPNDLSTVTRAGSLAVTCSVTTGKNIEPWPLRFNA